MLTWKVTEQFLAAAAIALFACLSPASFTMPPVVSSTSMGTASATLCGLLNAGEAVACAHPKNINITNAAPDGSEQSLFLFFAASIIPMFITNNERSNNYSLDKYMRMGTGCANL